MSVPAPRPNGPRNPLLVFLSLVMGIYVFVNVVFAGWYIIGSMTDDYINDHTVSCESAAEARAAGLYSDTLLVEPRVIRYGPYTVEFFNCFIAQTRRSHRPSWNARRVEEKQPNAWGNLQYRVRYEGVNPPEPYATGAPLLQCHQCDAGHYLNTGTFGQTQDMGFDAALINENHAQYIATELPIVLTITGHEKGTPDTLRIRAYPAGLRTQLPR